MGKDDFYDLERTFMDYVGSSITRNYLECREKQIRLLLLACFKLIHDDQVLCHRRVCSDDFVLYLFSFGNTWHCCLEQKRKKEVKQIMKKIKKFYELRHIKAQMQMVEDSLSIVKSRIRLHSVTEKQHNGAFYMDSVLGKLENELNNLENQKKQLQRESDLILKELSVLPEMPRKIMMYKYVYALNWVQISKKTGYSYEEALKLYKEAKKQLYSDID